MTSFADKGEFKDFRGLLGNQDDDRNGFFLDKLYKTMTHEGKTISVNAFNFGNDDFEVFNPSHFRTDAVVEWINYTMDVSFNINKIILVMTSPVSGTASAPIDKATASAIQNVKNSLNKIKNLRGNQKKFFEVLIPLLFTETPGLNVGNVTDFKFHPIDTLIINLGTIFKLNIGALSASKDTMVKIIKNLFPFTMPTALSGAATRFTYILPKYIFAKWMTGDKIIDVTDIPSFLDGDDMNGEYQRFYRKLDDMSKLYTINELNQEIEVQYNSKNTEEIFNQGEDNMCKNMGFQKTGDDCTNFLTKCLTDGGDENIANCKEFFEKPEFWAESKKEIKNMIPDVAVRILKRFGLITKNTYDTTAKRNLLKFESYQSWLTKLEKNSDISGSGGSFDQIKRNTKLAGYIKLVVELVNSSPAILNHDYAGVSDEGCITYPNEFKDTLLDRYGLAGRNVAFSATYNQGLQTLNLIRRRQENLIKLAAGPSPMRLGVLVGGGPVNTQTPRILKNYASVAASHILENTYLSFINQLKRKHKKINETDDVKIKVLLNQLKNSETKLIKALYYLEKYNEGTADFGNYDPNGFFNMYDLGEIQNKKDAVLSKVSSRQGNLVNILESILSAVGDADAEE